MSPHSVLNPHRASYLSAGTLEDVILAHLDEQAAIALDTLVALLPDYSWSQVFHAVDRLARRGCITLRRYRSEYTLFAIHYVA